MARGPNEKVLEAKKLYDTGMRLVEISKQLKVPAGTVRRWKSTYGWEKEEKKIGNKEGSKEKQKGCSPTRQKQSERFNKQQSERSNQKQSERSCQNKTNVPIQSKQEPKAVAEEVREGMQHTELTEKQQLFCISYVRCFNATKAYQKAYGVDYAVAAVSGSRLLGNVKIKEEIQRLKQERLNREFLNEADIFQKYLDIAFADITDYTEFGTEEIEVTDKNTGEVKEITINYVNLKESNEIDGTLISEVSKGRDGIKVKLADRMKALQWLSDHMDLATEKQKAEIALLKAKVEIGMEQEENRDDGFVSALNISSEKDWSDEES